jgi:gamma-glutamylcyclotransferase (GGCT)/AIG2-like uncharacterized protein YtfP
MSNESADGAMVSLFSYGTLQLAEVQHATFGRLLEGKSDALVGYRLAPLVITDPGVVATSGLEVHMIACRSDDDADRVPGVVFEVTRAELDGADGYETDAYARVEVTLESGARAFVYVEPDA